MVRLKHSIPIENQEMLIEKGNSSDDDEDECVCSSVDDFTMSESPTFVVIDWGKQMPNSSLSRSLSGMPKKQASDNLS